VGGAHHPELVRALILGDNMMFAPHSYPMYVALFGWLARSARKAGQSRRCNRHRRIELHCRMGESVFFRNLPRQRRIVLGSHWARCVAQPIPTLTIGDRWSALEGWNGETVLRGITCPTLLLQASRELGGLIVRRRLAPPTGCYRHHTHVNSRARHALFIQQLEPVLRQWTLSVVAFG